MYLTKMIKMAILGDESEYIMVKEFMLVKGYKCSPSLSFTIWSCHDFEDFLKEKMWFVLFHQRVLFYMFGF